MPFIRLTSTIFIFGMLTIVGIILLQSYINRNDIQWNQNAVIRDLSTDISNLTISPEDNIEIRFTIPLYDVDVSPENVRKYIEVGATQVQTNPNSNVNSTTSQYIDSVP